MKQRARLSFIARKKEIPKNENLCFANFQTKFDRYFSYRLLHACEQTIVLFHISRTIFLINNGQFSRRFFEPDLRKIWIYTYVHISNFFWPNFIRQCKFTFNLDGGKLYGEKILEWTIRVLTPAAARSTHIDTWNWWRSRRTGRPTILARLACKRIPSICEKEKKNIRIIYCQCRTTFEQAVEYQIIDLSAFKERIHSR